MISDHLTGFQATARGCCSLAFTPLASISPNPNRLVGSLSPPQTFFTQPSLISILYNFDSFEYIIKVTSVWMFVCMSHHHVKTAGPFCPKFWTPPWPRDDFLLERALDEMYLKNVFFFFIFFFGVEGGFGWGGEGKGDGRGLEGLLNFYFIF